MKNIAFLIIGVVMLVALFPMVMDAMHDIQTAEQTDTDLTRSDNSVTLTHDLWDADLGSVISAVDNENNTLTATAYNSATRALTLSGWGTEATSATVVYEVDGLSAYVGLGAIVGLTPLLIWIGILVALLSSIWVGIKGRFGG